MCEAGTNTQCVCFLFSHIQSGIGKWWAIVQELSFLVNFKKKQNRATSYYGLFYSMCVIYRYSAEFTAAPSGHRDVLDIIWTSYVRSIYVLCPGGGVFFNIFSPHLISRWLIQARKTFQNSKNCWVPKYIQPNLPVVHIPCSCFFCTI